MAFINVRLASVIVNDFMNVVHGELLLNSTDNIANPSILGLFGQNGSGKTALIRALSILKNLLMGQPLKDQWADCICVDSDRAQLQFEFHLYADVESRAVVRVFYQVILLRGIRDEKQKLMLIQDKKNGIEIQAERLWALPFNDNEEEKNLKPTLIMDTSSQESPFEPVAVYEQLVGNKTEIKNDLIVGKRLAFAHRTSFVFSEALEEALLKKSKEIKELPNNSDEILTLLLRLQQYGESELFVIESSESSLVSRNTLPMWLKVNASEKHSSVHGLLLLPLDESFTAAPKLMTVIREIIEQLNIVLVQLVPGLTIELETLGSELGADGDKLERAQFVSHKNKKEIPLKYESDGIKKIIAILHLLICVYNQRSITVAIDELDSGVFEYLLGELLKIISQGGRGQLIFTSHNLRALETLEPMCVAFTTANPKNRYAAYQNNGETVNLRDVYYRNLVLGTGEIQRLYTPTDNGRIAFAMREAGQNYR
mgnify:CR=1 FL=1